MRTTIAVLLIFAMTGACQSGPRPREEAGPELFAPASMRIHPIFTQAKDWTGDGEVDGIEVLIEFRDQFGDLTKAAGTAVFELFTYRPYHADVRGERIVNPWVGSLRTVDEQRARWNPISRTYLFRLQSDEIGDVRDYVLAGSFDLAGGERFFDQIVLESREPETNRDATPAAADERVGAP